MIKKLKHYTLKTKRFLYLCFSINLLNPAYKFFLKPKCTNRCKYYLLFVKILINHNVNNYLRVSCQLITQIYEGFCCEFL